MAALPGTFDDENDGVPAGEDGDWVEIALEPGIVTMATARGAKNRWKSGDHVRWHESGMPEKVGGCVKLDDTEFNGVCRALFDWQTLALTRYIALGTHTKLYVWNGGTYSDLTPLRDSGTLGTDPITTASGSAIVAIEDTAHGLRVGDNLTLDGATAVGGITVDGAYTVTALGDHTGANTSDFYRITHSAAASSTATGGGSAVDYEYEINVGNEHATAGLGWGVGGYGMGTWGTARTDSDIVLPPRTWSLDKWGEDLLACPRDGKLYVWDASAGVGTRAALITNAPAQITFMAVSQRDRHVIVFGCTDTSNVFDPLAIRWCDSEDYTAWTPAEDNEAGQLRADGRGTAIQCVFQRGNEFLIVTDRDAHKLFWVGPPEIFGVDKVAVECGAVSAKAGVDVAGVGYWMGNKSFWMHDGVVREMPCEMWDFVFEDFNEEQGGKVHAFVISQFSEIWWLYPSAGSVECDRAIIYNYMLRVWYPGTWARTAGMDASGTTGRPVLAGSNRLLYSHEVGVNDDTDALAASLESYDMELGNGKQTVRVRKLMPDFDKLEGSIDVTLKARKTPHGRQRTKGPRAVTATTEKVGMKIKGRQIALAVGSSGFGDNWRMGNWRAYVTPEGEV